MRRWFWITAPVVAVGLVVAMLGSCRRVEGSLTYHVSGRLVNPAGEPVTGWVGLTERRAEPAGAFGPVADREAYGEPGETWLGLTHTRPDGRFTLAHTTGPAWGYNLLLGCIPVGDTTPPEPDALDRAFVHVHDGTDWRSVRVELSADQQARVKPGSRWVHTGTVALEEGQAPRPGAGGPNPGP